MEMSMGLFFCTFPCFLYRGGSSSHLLGCVFHSHLLCLCSDPKVEWGAHGFLCLPQTLLTFLPVTALRSLPCCAQGFQASWFMPAVQGPHGVVQIGVTISGQHLALFLCGRGVIYSLEGDQILHGDLQLYSLRAGC